MVARLEPDLRPLDEALVRVLHCVTYRIAVGSLAHLHHPRLRIAALRVHDTHLLSVAKTPNIAHP